MYLKELIDKYGKKVKYRHEGIVCSLGFHKDNDKAFVWFFPDGEVIKDNVHGYNGYKRVILHECFLDDKWEVEKEKGE